MAIPQGRMSTEVVKGIYLPPEDRKFYATVSYEKGPIEIEDTREGLQYQDWTLTWNPNTHVLEAYPENNMRHLSAESALYVRIITEGLLGIEPTGFNSFMISPYLPENWENFKLEKIKAFKSSIDISLKRTKKGVQLTVLSGGRKIYDKKVSSGEKIEIKL
jgi:hypothetical protein